VIKAEQACRRSDRLEKHRKRAANVALMRKHGEVHKAGVRYWVEASSRNSDNADSEEDE
jgi:hypothetical protein